MKISFSIAALVLAVASVATAAPAPAPGRAPGANPVASPVIDEEDARPAPPDIVKILKKIGWLSANYTSPASGGPTNPSLNPPPRDNSSPRNSTQNIEKRASSCRSSTLFWFERHYVDAMDDLERHEMAEHWFRLMVSPYKYESDIPAARSAGKAPRFLETRIHKDRKWGVTHDWNFETGVVTMNVNRKDRTYTMKNNYYLEKENGWWIVTNQMVDCIDWYD